MQNCQNHKICQNTPKVRSKIIIAAEKEKNIQSCQKEKNNFRKLCENFQNFSIGNNCQGRTLNGVKKSKNQKNSLT